MKIIRSRFLRIKPYRLAVAREVVVWCLLSGVSIEEAKERVRLLPRLTDQEVDEVEALLRRRKERKIDQLQCDCEERIAQVVSIVKNKDDLLVVSEYCARGDLKSHLTKVSTYILFEGLGLDIATVGKLWLGID